MRKTIRSRSQIRNMRINNNKSGRTENREKGNDEKQKITTHKTIKEETLPTIIQKYSKLNQKSILN